MRRLVAVGGLCSVLVIGHVAGASQADASLASTQPALASHGFTPMVQPVWIGLTPWASTQPKLGDFLPGWQEQDQGHWVYVALDADGDDKFDDNDHDGQPDSWFKVGMKFAKSCGPVAMCLVAPPGLPQLLCAGKALYNCLDAYQ